MVTPPKNMGTNKTMGVLSLGDGGVLNIKTDCTVDGVGHSDDK